VGERIKKITRRMKRLFKKEEARKPRPISASQVICPEKVIREHGKRAPKPTSKFKKSELTRQDELVICVLPDGTTCVAFDVNLSDVPVRDPVTRRLSRKELTDGMRQANGFYDSKGNLRDESRIDW
jgi:hypothetical protein